MTPQKTRLMQERRRNAILIMKSNDAKFKHIRQEALDSAKHIVLKGLGPVRARVYLFGSYARKDSWPSSDIDIAILPDEPLPTGLLGNIREKLEESRIPYTVDLVNLQETSEPFRKRVQQEGILWKG